jgi:hypothetical protein
MSKSAKPRVGDVVAIALPSGGRAYARVLRDASIAVYRGGTDASGPPIGSRDYQFVVGIYEDTLRKLPVVGRDPSANEAEDWPPPHRITSRVPGPPRIYHRGEIRPAVADEAHGLEVAAVWELEHIIERLQA